MIVYSKPDCPNCESLKQWLKSNEFEYNESVMNTEVSTDLIMRDIFSDPPILELEDGMIFPAKSIFDKTSEIRPIFIAGMISRRDESC